MYILIIKENISVRLILIKNSYLLILLFFYSIMSNIDLHIHTTHSDGTFSPRRIVDYALSKKMKAIAITDHNSISGVSPAIAYSKGKNIEIVSGVEIDCYESTLNVIIHVVGLFIDQNNKDLINNLKKQKRKLFNYLIRAIKVFLKKTIFSSLLIKLKKIFMNKKPVAIPFLSLEKTIKIINSSGGIAILAHPGMINKEKLDFLIKLFKEYGGKGIEVYYPYNKIYEFNEIKAKETISRIKKIAKKENLLFLGGSDFHGYGRNVDIGEAGISNLEFERLKAR